jgi:hypothetical protein
MLNTKKVFVGMLAVGAIAASASAVNYTWTGNVSRSMSNAANWTPSGGPPGSGDTAVIPNVANDPIIDANFTVANVTLQSGATLDYAASSSYTLTVTSDFKLQGTSGFTLTNAANEVILNSATSRILVDGSALAVSISGPGSIKMDHASATIDIPDSDDQLTFDGTLYGRGQVISSNGGGTYVNDGYVDARHGTNPLVMGSGVVLSDDSGMGSWLASVTGATAV